jgi:hypothetical protein
MVSTEDAMNYYEPSPELVAATKKYRADFDRAHPPGLPNAFLNAVTKYPYSDVLKAPEMTTELRFGDGGTKLRHIPVVDHEALAEFRLGVIEALQVEVRRLRDDLQTAANLYFGLRQDPEPLPTKGEVLANALKADSYWTGA